MTKVGIESLLALKEALEGFGATQSDLEDIFWNNALRCLGISEQPSKTGASAWQRGREVISCGTGLLSKRAESFLTPEWPAYFSKASGCRVWDADGRMFLDFVGGIGAVILGYADEEINRAVARRLAQGSYCSLLAQEEVELAQLLLELHPGMGKVRYARGGGEAMGLAVRIARAATNKSGIAFCGYHGWQDWYLAANIGFEADGRPVPGLNPLGVPRELKGTSVPFVYNDIESLERAVGQLGDNLAALVMEPLRSQQPTPEFLKAIHALVKDKSALLVVDEVSSGMRCGFPGIASRLGLQADLLVYAKAISNGIPFGVVVGKREVMESAEASFISSSYWTDGLGSAAALAVLKKIQRENIQQQLQKKGDRLMIELQRIAKKYPSLKISLTGMSVMPRFHFDLAEKTEVVKMRLTEEMLGRGFLFSGLIYLMHAHTEEDIHAMLEALDASLKVVEDELAGGLLDSIQTLQTVSIGRLA